MAQTEQFETLYRTQYARVRRICMGYTGGDAGLADDLAQETFMKAWENYGKFRGESAVSTWLYRIAVNTCLTFFRNRKRGKRMLSLDQVPEQPQLPEPEVQEPILNIQQLYSFIDQLRPMNRSILLLELEGVPQKEIAAITGLTHSAVRTRIHRIKNDLLKQMKRGLI